jgi:NTE family protein
VPSVSAQEPQEQAALERAAAPVHPKAAGPREADGAPPADGVALCLSGGGYRAMLFHLGALMRLNELGWLPKLDRISSVSGGSITAGVLACRWHRLDFGDDGVAKNFVSEVAEPLRALAGRTIDLPAIVLGVLLPGSIGNRLAGSYRRHLFGATGLNELPGRPRFVINATSLQSGVLWRFSRPYLWDWRVGEVRNPTTPIATAVAASSAFPPFLSPVVLGFRTADFVPGSGTDLERDEFRRKVVLTDGGVYDNLGLETAWKSARTVLISDGGGRLHAQARPWRFWPLQLYRVLGVIDNQVRSLRKRQAIGGYQAGLREGTYWGIRGHAADYQLPDSLPCPPEQTERLAELKTRLASMPDLEQERLLNWGYAICDTAMRRHVVHGVAPPAGFPYPLAGLG